VEGDGDALQRTLEIDILCGASAGGLNAALLATAIENDRVLDECECAGTQWSAPQPAQCLNEIRGDHPS
jgi:hypothetical protein